MQKKTILEIKKPERVDTRAAFAKAAKKNKRKLGGQSAIKKIKK